LLCKHQVIGSIPIGSTNPRRRRQFSAAKLHRRKDGQRRKAQPQGAALLRLTAATCAVLLSKSSDEDHQIRCFEQR
jgi:hypothetical protein